MDPLVQNFLQQSCSQRMNFNALFQAATLYEQAKQHFNLEECCSQLSIHLHTVEEQLYDKIWNTQQQCMETMQDIENLQQQLVQLTFQVKESKQNLSSAAKQTHLNGDDIISLERRRKLLRRVQNSLVDVQKLIRTSILAQVALKKDQLTECHNLCKQWESIQGGKERGDLTKLTCLRNLRERVVQIAVECVKRMHKNLRNLCRKLTKDGFWTIFVAYEEIGAAEALALRLNEEYSRAIADVPTQLEIKYAEEKAKERQFILFGFELFGDILVSFHSLLAYLNSLCRNDTMKQQNDKERRDPQSEDKDIQQFGEKQVSREEFVRIILSHLISKEAFWEMLQDQVVKWLQELGKENVSVAVTSMRTIYYTAYLFQVLGEVFIHCSENTCISPKPTDQSNLVSSSMKVVKMTGQWLEKSFEQHHEENLEIFRKHLRQETWQQITTEATDFTTFFSTFEDLASTFQEKQDLRDSIVELLNEEKNPLSVWSLENICLFSSREHSEKRLASVLEQVYDSYVFVSSCLILLNIVTRYLELAVSIPCWRTSILLTIAHLLQLYFCHVYSVCNFVCRQTEVELEKQERGRELVLEDFLHSKDRALLAQLRQEAVLEWVSSNANISKCDACVAIESWKSLTELFSPCWKLLETSEYPDSLRRWNAVFSLTVPLRSAVYDCIAAQIIGARQFIQEITNTDYRLHASHSFFQTDNIALQDQSSPAISRVLQNIKKWKETEALPPNVCLETLWERIAATCCHTFVVGVSKVKHCTPEGRARMLVDLRHLERGLELFTGLRPIPGAQRAASHIRAYFLDEKEILSWVETEAIQWNFTDAQLENLIETGPGRNLSRFAKNNLIQNVLQIYHQSKQKQSTPSEPCTTIMDSNYSSTSSKYLDDAVPMDNIFGKDELSEIFTSDQS